MKHCSDEELILHYYGEHPKQPRVERHLASCPACARAREALGAELALMQPRAVPERDEHYGLALWHRIRHRLPEQESRWHSWLPSRLTSPLGAAAVVAALIVGAFAAGRTWPVRQPSLAEPVPAAEDVTAGIEPGASERVRLAALADHFERSEHMLLDVVTAGDGTFDLRDQQSWAELLTANRLYRDASKAAGDEPVIGVLDELERTLLELVHGPATLTVEELEQVRLRLDAAALLFKVRVLSGTLRDRENETPDPRTTT